MADMAAGHAEQRGAPRADAARGCRADLRARLRRDAHRRRRQARRGQLGAGHLLLRHPRSAARRRAALLRAELLRRRRDDAGRGALGARAAVAAHPLDVHPARTTTTCPARGGSGSTCGPRRSGTPRSSRTASSSTPGGARMIVDVVNVRARPTATSAAAWTPAPSRSTFAALLDGLSIQVALEDPEVDPTIAYRIAMPSPSANSAWPRSVRPAPRRSAPGVDRAPGKALGGLSRPGPAGCGRTSDAGGDPLGRPLSS